MTHRLNTPEAIAKRLATQRARTQCSRGHEYTDENTYVSPRGVRVCRTCRNAARRFRYQQGKQHMASLSIGCELKRHNACDPTRFGCECNCHKRQPKLGPAPLPPGFPVRRVAAPQDALESLLRRLEAQG